MIKIRGRGLFQNKTEVIEQIMNWIDEYLSNPAATTYVIIAFEYLNSFSTTILVSILRKLSQVILQSGKLVIQWYYEEDDEDILERGEYISSTLDIPIIFILTNHIADL
jgi:SiaC family regulatory phosphoprotein